MGILFKLLACSDCMIDHELMEADNHIRQLNMTDMRYVCSQFMYSTCLNSGTNISSTMRPVISDNDIAAYTCKWPWAGGS